MANEMTHSPATVVDSADSVVCPVNTRRDEDCDAETRVLAGALDCGGIELIREIEG